MACAAVYFRCFDLQEIRDRNSASRPARRTMQALHQSHRIPTTRDKNSIMSAAHSYVVLPAIFKPAASSFYAAAVAKAFFEASGQPEKIAVGTTLFVENEKSSKKNIFTKLINANLFNKSITHRMYLLTQGTVELTAGGKLFDTMGLGDVFGEMALVDQSPRTASAIAGTECALLSINREALIGLVKSDQSIGMAMTRCVAARIRYMNSLFA